MAYEIIAGWLVKVGEYATLSAAKAAAKRFWRRSSAQQQNALISVVTRELLAMSPDLDKAEAALLAEKATGADPTAESVRIRRLFDELSHQVTARRKKKKAAKRKSKKKAAKRKAKKKAAKRKAKKKT